MQEETCDHRFHWLYRMLHVPEAAGLTEHWNGLLRGKFKNLLENNTQQERGAVPQGAVDPDMAQSPQ